MGEGLLIVGASLAGAKAAEGARAQGYDGPIRLIGAEPHLPYERPPLSKGLLLGKEPPAKAAVEDTDWYVRNEVGLLLGAPATALDLGAKEVDVAGRRIGFETLVLATGSTPRKLPVPGMDLPEVLVLRTVDDALALREALKPGVRVAVVGASWIGTEVASAAQQRGAEVVMADPLSQPLERVLGAEIGAFYAEVHRSHGIDLRVGVGVEGVEGDDHVTGLRLAGGDVVPADLVVVGVGVRPNVELATAAGLDVEGGVLVDEHLRTSHPDVFAAGDIADEWHPLVGRRVRVEHWANALNQGKVAGANAAGASQVYDRVPYFFSDQWDVGMEYSGWPVPFDRVVVRGELSTDGFVAFYLADGKVVGGINVNVWDVNEHVQALIRSGAVVDADRLADTSVDPATWAS
jgi:3-phenylpropionate/trans-cinnamate dioxygenase ferredoxin reductase subunit